MNSSVFLVFLELIIPLVPLNRLCVVSHFLPVWSPDLCCPPLHLGSWRRLCPVLRAVPVPHPAPSTALLLKTILLKVLQTRQLPPKTSSWGSCVCLGVWAGLPSSSWLSAPISIRWSRNLGVRAQRARKRQLVVHPHIGTHGLEEFFRFSEYLALLNRQEMGSAPGASRLPRAFPTCCSHPRELERGAALPEHIPARPVLVYWEC